MSLLPDDATFEEQVQECFVAFRGSGLMLSALDAQLLAEWARAKVPFEVVARGIRRVAEKAAYDARPGESGLRTLRACKREVEAEIERFRAREAGRGEPQRASTGLAGLAERRPELAEALARSKRHGGPDRADRVVAELLRALPFAERLAILHNARSQLPPGPLSVRALRLTRRFHRSLALAEALGVRGIG